MSLMKRHKNTDDDFWTERNPLFTMQFPSYYTKPQSVWGRFHTAQETYLGAASELVPLKHKKGQCIYIMMQPYVLEPRLTISVALDHTPKKYADQESPIGRTVGQPQMDGFREEQVGNAQAWFYPEDKMIVLWECFFDSRSRRYPLAEDENMQKLWNGFERWLIREFPTAETIATPLDDPIAHSIAEYQAFLQVLGYEPIAEAAYGKKVDWLEPYVYKKGTNE
jgi:hypothetical protein